MRVAVLASGSGSNLQALLDTCVPPAPAQIALVASNKPEAGSFARAERVGVATFEIRDPADSDALLDAFAAHQVDFVVLAGYLKLVPASVVNAFAGRMVNIHPALLPSFGGKGMYGMRVHRAVLESGATLSGPTVHLVTSEYDRGPILAQWPVPVHADDEPESLRDRVLAVEHQLLPAVVLAAAQHGRAVRLTARNVAFAVGAGPARAGEQLEAAGESQT